MQILAHRTEEIMKEDKHIKEVKSVLKTLESEEGFGKDKCKGYNPECGNCRGQVLIGYLNWYLELLEWEDK